MKIINAVRTTLIGCLIAVLTSFSAVSDEKEGLLIAGKRKTMDEGWGDSQAKLTMLLSNASGNTSERKLRIKRLEIKNDGDKGLTIFDTPLDVKGTAFLNFSHAIEPDEQWLYLPALKRIKRIASRNKSGPFMGSEFAYEDLSSFELEKYTFNYLGKEQLGENNTFLIEQIPVDSNSGYTKQLVWLDEKHYQPLKVEYYDRKGVLLKTLQLLDYQLYEGKFWRANRLEMRNSQTKKSTTLITEQLQFATGLKANDFNRASLKRVR